MRKEVVVQAPAFPGRRGVAEALPRHTGSWRCRFQENGQDG